MTTNANRNRPDLRIQIQGGRLTVDTKLKTIGRAWFLFLLLIVLILLILAIVDPGRWIDILKAFLQMARP